MKFKDRIKTVNFWTTLSAAVILLLQTLGKAFGFTFSADLVNDIIMGVCGVLVVLGVVLPEKKKEETKTDNEEENTEDPN